MQHALATADAGLTVDAHDGDLASPARARTVCQHYNYNTEINGPDIFLKPEAGQAWPRYSMNSPATAKRGGGLGDAGRTRPCGVGSRH